ncbi:hypothetical protein EVAR_21479_1 [Eumeta japonica]|uniref:Uncharacterized protein n=1 Tax=Eumeta variegata TaxID=151549 RepID=A0A4C1ZN47_EUMVA|nr:hypothetical protein EVAR_21479_1 [Eumeta japonica]
MCRFSSRAPRALSGNEGTARPAGAGARRGGAGGARRISVYICPLQMRYIKTVASSSGTYLTPALWDFRAGTFWMAGGFVSTSCKKNNLQVELLGPIYMFTQEAVLTMLIGEPQLVEQITLLPEKYYKRFNNLQPDDLKVNLEPRVRDNKCMGKIKSVTGDAGSQWDGPVLRLTRS